MTLFANLGRVVASESVLPDFDKAIANETSSPLMLMFSADLHWRRKEWEAAIEPSLRTLSMRPKDFHALSIVLTSYGHLRQFENAHPYAKKLLLSRPPNWTAVKVMITALTALKLLTANGRASYRKAMRRCDQEAQADRDALAWAKELIASREAAIDSVAV